MKTRTTKRRPIRISIAAAALAVLAIGAALLLINQKRERPPLTADEIASALAGNEYSSGEERAVVEAAVSLVGKVHYFWGGKYDGIGPDPAWGELREVTSEGSATTGEERPWGLDCSGFVTWAFIQAGFGPADIGHGTWNQWYASEQIDLGDIRPGDLVFANSYPGNRGNHIGICIGFIDGEAVAVHCSSSFDNVVVTRVEDGFKYFRRPILWADAQQNGVAG